MNALDAARLGMDSLTHMYGLFEPLYKHHQLQPYPADMNYADEQMRFAEVAKQWNRLHEKDSEAWNALLDEFLALDFYLNPTLAVYAASRDLMRARNADWHSLYGLPSQWQFFQPSRAAHGAYWFYWTTEHEIGWKNFYRVWMALLNDYKNKGGKVTVGSDAGYIYNLYGFGTIHELEMLQEAGFHPLEVIRAATMHGAMEIAKPTGKAIEYGVLRPGMLADLLIVEENPLQNFKVLYGTGAERLNDETGQVERVGGVKFTIKDGIVYDAKRLLAEVADLVAQAKVEDKDKTKATGDSPVAVILETTLGNIDVDVYPDKAPLSAASFLSAVDSGLLTEEGFFYRAVTHQNDTGHPKINVIQGGVLKAESMLPLIFHEPTNQTGLSHQNGAVSLARAPDSTGTGTMFFISIGDQPGLDYGATRYEDGLGFAVFGQVTQGMSVVKAIQAQQTTEWPDQADSPMQYIDPPVRILKAYRRAIQR